MKRALYAAISVIVWLLAAGCCHHICDLPALPLPPSYQTNQAAISN